LVGSNALLYTLVRYYDTDIFSTHNITNGEIIGTRYERDPGWGAGDKVYGMKEINNQIYMLFLCGTQYVLVAYDMVNAIFAGYYVFSGGYVGLKIWVREEEIVFAGKNGANAFYGQSKIEKIGECIVEGKFHVSWRHEILS
jgi:hypothetical protein